MKDQKPEVPERDPIRFRPVTDGLGFHPFSDGLPYAPIGKKASPSVQKAVSPTLGSGAITAGPPQVSSRIVSQSINPIKKSSTSVPQISVPVVKSAAPSLSQPQVQIQPQASVLAAVESYPGWGYVLKRGTAFLMDSAMSTFVFALSLCQWIWRQEVNTDLFFDFNVIAVGLGILFFFNWFSILVQELCFKTSLGKYLFGLRLQANEGRLILRSLLFLPSVFLGGLGVLWALVDPRKRCWHDLASDSQPVEVVRW